MSNVWFTADTHFGHCNIIKYCNRPFQDGDHQDTVMVDRFNEVLRPGDRLYHLGDVAHSSCDIRAIWDRLNVGTIYLTPGNHDKLKLLGHRKLIVYPEIKSISIDKHRCVLCHYPMRSWAGRGHGAFQLYGHVHGRMPGIGRQMDVGVDTNDFRPYALEEVVKMLESEPFYADESTLPDSP